MLCDVLLHLVSRIILTAEAREEVAADVGHKTAGVGKVLGHLVEGQF